MHSDGSSPIEDSVHSEYEHAVDQRCTAASCRYQMHFDDVTSSGHTPRRSRPPGLRILQYESLIRAYAAHGYDGTVDRITRRQLNRAANEVADLIWSLRR